MLSKDQISGTMIADTAEVFDARKYIPFLRDELPMPPQNRVGRDHRADLAQSAPSQPMPQDGKSPSMIISELEPLSTQLTSKDTILFNEVRQGTSLPAIQPASQNREHHLEGRRVDHASQQSTCPRDARSANSQNWLNVSTA
jgi:hypothetical protein